jgi:hypothetical protein
MITIANLPLVAQSQIIFSLGVRRDQHLNELNNKDILPELLVTAAVRFKRLFVTCFYGSIDMITPNFLTIFFGQMSQHNPN